MAIVVVLLPLGSRTAASQSSSLIVSGDPSGPLTAIPSSDGTPGSVTSVRTTYTITVIAASAKKISGSINAAMPANTTLSVLLEVPFGTTGVTSSGNVLLSTTPITLITGLAKVTAGTGGIIYTFTATVAAGVVPASSRLVTFTVANAP